jgi:AAA+ superfamily predicted ATPase
MSGALGETRSALLGEAAELPDLTEPSAPAPSSAPAGSDAAEPAFLRRIRLRARRRVLWLRTLWAADAAGGLGVAITHGEVDRILTDADSVAEAERAFHAADPAARALAPAIADADDATADNSVVRRLRRDFALRDAEVDLLLLAAAVEVDPWLRRVFGYLHDDATASLPTPWLGRQLFEWPADAAFGPESGLLRWRLARPVDGAPSPWSIATPWVADPHVASWLRSGPSMDPRLAGAVELFAPARPDPAACLYPAELAAMTDFVRALAHDRGPTMALVLRGPPGAGKRTLARQACDQLRVPLLVADAGQLMGPAVDAAAAAEAMVLVTRSARMLRAALYWHDSDGAAPAAWRESSRRVALSIFGTTATAPAAAIDEEAARRTVELPPLTRAARARLWSALSEEPAPAPVLDWSLLPSDIARAAAVSPAGPDAVVEACRATLPVESTALASPLPRPYVWDDLVLSPSVREHLDELEQQARLRWPVYEEWGFQRMCPMGRGIAALFAGPSGTGKTMAAQVLARALGMEIYRIDLAGVVSKYIGETEKNLRQVFEACERANVLLFFDEADALFGQRTQVKDAHDRFANIEIDYLLQRMEQFDGIAVLATNRRGDIDSAFLRRLRFIVDFVPPGVAERRRLWTLALPARAPDGSELLDAIDWDRLAQRLDMTGAEIKAAAMRAAFLARSEGVRIGMNHLVRAARRELVKRGVAVRGGDLGLG